MRRRLLVAAALWCLCSGLPYWSLPGLWGDEALPPAQAPPRLAALDIETAVELALGASDELRHARIERDIAAERTRLSLRSFFPAVTLGYAQNDSVVYGAADSRLKRLSVGLRQVLFARGSRVSGYRLGNLELGVQSRALAQARTALMLKATNLYLGALKLELERRILEDSYRNIQAQIRIAAEELRLGEITELAYLELAVAGKDQELELSRRRQAEERGAFELQQALGLSERVPLAGSIDEDYQGLLAEREPDWFVQASLARNLELRRQEAELYGLRGQLEQSRLSWLPGVSARAELSMAGEDFPLTQPGFSLGLELDFAPPLLPASTGTTAGSSGPRERSAGVAGSLELGGNVEGVLAVRLAALHLDQACSRLDSIRRNLEFAVREQLKSRVHQLEALQLLREKRAIQERTQAIRSLMVDLGEITRLQLVEGEVELAALRIEILSAVVALFNQEVSLMEQCGLPGVETSYRAIIRKEDASARHVAAQVRPPEDPAP